MSNNGNNNIVARGRIKVDARKAQAKLRDHMLVDHHLYACEVARVAQALDAKSIAIEYDADDVILTFGGRLLPIEALARVRDYVLTPSEGPDGDALRLLGIAVSAALALDPSFVDLIRVDPTSAQRVRFESHHADEDADVAPPVPKNIERPKGTTEPFFRFHVRKKLGLDVLGRAMRSPVPRELRLLADRSVFSQLAMKMTPDTEDIFGRRRLGACLVRVDLDEPSLLRGALEVLHPSSANVEGENTLTFCERGVLLARYPLADCWNLAREGEPLPIRVIVDAMKLPTNASRSELRMDADLVTRVRARIGDAFESAIDVLEAIGIRNEAPKIGRAFEVVHPDRTVLLHALGAIVSHVAIALRSGTPLPERAKARIPGLLSLPILFNAVGVAISFAQLRGGGSSQKPLLIYSGTRPAPIELGPWLSEVVWRRGLTAEAALEGLFIAPADDLVARAQEGFTRRQRALEHPPSVPSLPATSTAYVLKESFAVAEGPFKGLRGEVAVVRTGPHYRRAAAARLFVDQRPLESMALPGVSLPIDLAIEWPSRIVPRFTYDGVERNEDLTHALLYTLRVATIAIGERAAKVRGQADDAELVRLAITAWAGATKTLGDGDPDHLLSELGRLAGESVWPTTDGHLVSLSVLVAYVNRTGALCVAHANAGAAVDGRPVLDERQVAAVKELLPPKTLFIPYARALAQPSNDSPLAMVATEEMSGLPAIAFQRSKVEGFVVVAAAESKLANRRRVYHAGFRLSDEVYRPRNGPVTVVLNDRAAVPTVDFAGKHWSTPISTLQREEDALVETVVTHCERGEIDLDAVRHYLDISRLNMRERNREGLSAEDRQQLDTLTRRLAELPSVISRRRLLTAQAALLAKPPLDVEALLGPAPRASATSDFGKVTVRLAGADPIRAEVLFQGHSVCSTSIGELPLVSIIETQRQDLLVDWIGLSPDGLQWANNAVTDAALQLLRTFARHEEFANTSSALDLAIALHGASPVRAALALRSSRWPTVQGGTMALPDDPSSIPSGTKAYATYRAGGPNDASPHDAPALHLPKSWLGDLRLRLLTAMAHDLVDVTDSIARLQARRAKGLPSAPPRLDGPRSLLRTTLAELGIESAEGELELIDGIASDVWRLNDDGTKTQVLFTIQCPIRAIFRSDNPRDSGVLLDLAKAVERFVRRLGESQINAVPTFVRDRLRSLICAALSNSGKLNAADSELPVFPTVRSGWHALGPLMAAAREQKNEFVADVHATRDRPPFPEADLETLSLSVWMDPILLLTEGEIHALGKMLRVNDVTDDLRREFLGAQRRNAPPVSEIALTPEMRAECIATFGFIDEGVRGEIGLLRPAHVSSRRIEVYTRMRALCWLPDPDGWPVIAVVNDDQVEPVPAFDAIGRAADESRIQRVIRNAVGKQLPNILEAPKDMLGIIRLPAPHLLREIPHHDRRVVSAIGVFWVEPVWPDTPEVQVEAIGIVDPYRRPRAPKSDGAHSRLLPIRGRVWLSTDAANVDAALEEVFQWVRLRLPSILRLVSKGMARKEPKEIAAYEWDLALLDVVKDANRDPVAELARDRPAEALMRVAVRRAPHLVKAIQTEQDTGPEKPPLIPDVSGDQAHVVVDDIDPAKPAPRQESFLGGLVRRVVDLVTGEKEEELSVTTPLGQALASALFAMKLTGNPVERVAETKRGRPISYDGVKKLVLLNTTHTVVKKLAEHPSGVVHALAAAVSEINRELVPVTDAEELAVLRDLLRANDPG